MPGKWVVNTSTLRCSKGSEASNLIVPLLQGAGVMLGPAGPVATVGAYLPGCNIFPFGDCSATGSPCVPMTTSEWQDGPGVATGLRPVLTETGVLNCDVGGLIRVADPGQHSVDVELLGQEMAENLEEFESRFGDCREPIIVDGQLVGFLHEEQGVYRIRYLDGEQQIRELPLEEVDDLTIAITTLAGGAGIARALISRAAATEAAELAAAKAKHALAKVLSNPETARKVAEKVGNLPQTAKTAKGVAEAILKLFG